MTKEKKIKLILNSAKYEIVELMCKTTSIDDSDTEEINYIFENIESDLKKLDIKD